LWYQQSLEELDDALAHVGVARLILNGYAGAGSVTDAIRHLELAVAENNPTAMIILGMIYQEGKIVPKDSQRALLLYKEASQLGFIVPMLKTASLLAKDGKYWAAICLRARAAWSAWHLFMNDPEDRRLWLINEKGRKDYARSLLESRRLAGPTEVSRAKTRGSK
jgi:TPR repeat protein